jgi:hypothetical protein
MTDGLSDLLKHYDELVGPHAALLATEKSVLLWSPFDTYPFPHDPLLI